MNQRFHFCPFSEVLLLCNDNIIDFIGNLRSKDPWIADFRKTALSCWFYSSVSCFRRWENLRTLSWGGDIKGGRTFHFWIGARTWSRYHRGGGIFTSFRQKTISSAHKYSECRRSCPKFGYADDLKRCFIYIGLPSLQKEDYFRWGKWLICRLRKGTSSSTKTSKQKSS